MSKKIRIPTLKRDETNRRKALHLPLKVKDGKALTILDHDIKTFSYTWSEKYGPEASPGKIIGTALTLHEYGHPGLFKPSVYEVLCQLPKNLVEIPTWFIIHGPKTAGDFYRNMESEDETMIREIMEEPPAETAREAINAGFHTARTVFYERVI